MKLFDQKNILIFLIFFGSRIVTHGFGPQTLVQLSADKPETIYNLCLHALHDRVSVVSCDMDNRSIINKAVTKGKQSRTNCFIRLSFDSQPSNDILCTPTQEFYLSTTSQWIPAFMLKAGDVLLTQDMTSKPVTYTEFVPQPLKIYMLEIQESHTFFVGKYGVLTHNIVLPVTAYLGFTVPFGAVAAGTAGSFLGPIGLMGGIVIGGMVTIALKALYENRIHGYKIPAYNISFIHQYSNNTTSIEQEITPHSRRCFNSDTVEDELYQQVIPLEYPTAEKPIGCITIEISTKKNQSVPGYDISDEHRKIDSQGCFQPIEKNEIVLFNQQEKTTECKEIKTRYQGEKARNWDEFEKSCYIGQKYGKEFIHTGKQNIDGCPIKKLMQDIYSAEMFKKGYYFALDKFHEGDHFEVWDKKGKWIGVANLDGSKNHAKTNAVKNKPRRNMQ